jgi:hypothetical protein
MAGTYPKAMALRLLVPEKEAYEKERNIASFLGGIFIGRVSYLCGLYALST